MHCPTITDAQRNSRQTHRDAMTQKRKIAVSTQVRNRAVRKEIESLRLMTLNILMKKTCADWIGPRSVSLLCLSSKTKGHNWATVLLRVSIGDDFYLPVERGCLQEQSKVNRRPRVGKSICKLFYCFDTCSSVNAGVQCIPL